MSEQDTCCHEYERAARLSRRRFLQGVAATSTATVATTMFGDALRQATFAAPGDSASGNVLVVISLRGGIDGLGMVLPHGAPGYYTARRSLAVPIESLLARAELFCLHPNMAPLQSLLQHAVLAAVHAVGMEVPNRSHFLAMEEVEDADPASSVRRGWVNRMIGLDGDSAPSEAVHLTSSIVPTMLVGPAPTVSADRLEGISLAGGDGTDIWATRRRRALDMVWEPAGGPLGHAGRSALQTVDQLAPIAAAPYVPSNDVTYPDEWPATDLSAALKDTAQLIRAGVGTEVVSIDYGSWDMHSDYGTTEWGEMQSMVAGFAGALDAFLRDLGELRSKVTVVTISEFGRRIAENGNRGLDHGWGNMMLLAGGGVKGGQYYANWPGLGTDQLVDGDLAVTTDYRNVLGEVVAHSFPDRAIPEVFPGLTFQPLGVMTRPL